MGVLSFFRIVVIFTTILFFAPVALGQEPFFDNYTTEQGLPSSNVYCAYQDSKGYMWFGTDAGVVKYDGYSFKTYTTSDGLSDNEVFKIKEDLNHNLWFLTYSGTPTYLENGQFKQIQLNSEISSFLFTDFMCLDKSTVLLSSDKGEVFLIENYLETYSWSFENEDIRALGIEPNGTITCLGQYDLFSLDLKSKAVKTEHLADLHLNNFNVRSTYIQKESFLCGVKNKLFICEEGKFYEIWEFPIESEIIYVSIQNDFVLVGTRRGAFIFNYKNGELSLYQHVLKNESVASVVFDNAKNVWLTTLNNGVFVARNSKNVVYSKNTVLNEDIITCLSLDKAGNIWAGSVNNTFYKINLTSAQEYKVKGVRNDKVTSIRVFENDVWVVGKSFTSHIGKDSVKTDFPYFGNDIFIDGDNEYWLASGKASLYHCSEENFWRTKMVDGRSPVLGKNCLASFQKINSPKSYLIEPTNEGILIGTLGGLYIKYAVSDNITPILPEKISGVTALLHTDGFTIVGTRSQGVLFLKGNKLVRQFNKANSTLKSNMISSFTRDPKTGLIWVGTTQGVYSINSNGKLEDRSDKLGGNYFKINDLLFLKGFLYLGTNRGLIKVDLSENVLSKYRPKIYIDNISINGKKTIRKKNNIKLSHDQNNIAFHLTGLHYKSKGKKYHYKLEGYDKKWNIISHREINYQALPYGEYTLRVKCVTDDGYTSQVKSVKFSISPPFWETAWFRIIVLTLCILSAVIIWRIRLNVLSKRFNLEKLLLSEKAEKLAVEKSLVEIEHTALRMQMNPHFIFNALNTIKGYYAENRVVEANDYLNNFATLLRDILESSSKIISLSHEIGIIRNYLEMNASRRDSPFTFSIEVDDNLNTDLIGTPPMLVQPFVENSLIHGIGKLKDKGVVTIKIKQVAQTIQFEVIDNGTGIFNSQKKKSAFSKGHKSISIELTKNRLELISKNDNVDSRLEIEELEENGTIKGTRVVIIIPIYYV